MEELAELSVLEDKPTTQAASNFNERMGDELDFQFVLIFMHVKRAGNDKRVTE